MTLADGLLCEEPFRRDERTTGGFRSQLRDCDARSRGDSPADSIQLRSVASRVSYGGGFRRGLLGPRFEWIRARVYQRNRMLVIPTPARPIPGLK